MYVRMDVVDDVLVSTIHIKPWQLSDNIRQHNYETMVFGGEHNGYFLRYVTKEQADVGHESTMRMLRDKTH